MSTANMNHRLRNLIFLTLAAMLSTGCAEEEMQPDVRYQSTATVHDFMYWVLEPAADVIWDSAGYIITVEGEVDLQPTTQDGWDKVRNAATVVAEAGNLLKMPGYRADDGDWIEYAAGITQAALLARAAAEAQDADALFDAGGALYNVCRACHNRYIVQPQ
ncbi:MAG: hypothetical protein AAF541_08085 [Pseudomonadota bacterium]